MKAHPAHEVMEMEQLNIINDLVGRLHGVESKALSDIIVTKEQDSNIGSMFSWFDTLKIMALSTIGFIFLLISIRVFIACKIVPKLTKVRHCIQNSKFIKNRNKQAPAVELENMLSVNPETVYNALSINEPTFVRQYAPVPLQTIYTDNNTIQKYTPKPSAPEMLLSSNPQSSNTNILDKTITSKQNKSNPHKCLGPHTTCSYVVGHGMVWEDLCRCKDNDKST